MGLPGVEPASQHAAVEEARSQRRAALAEAAHRIGDRVRPVRLSPGDGAAATRGLDGQSQRVERLWRQEGLKVPLKQPKRKRQWLADGSCVRLRPSYEDHVWSYDFVADRTSDGRAIRMLTLIDEHTRECLAIDVARSLKSEDVLERLSDLFVHRGVPTYIRSDNGAEFTATKLREWLARVGVTTLFIEPGSPWENGYVESFNGKLRDELLAREQFDTLLEAKVLIERWRRHFNEVRPHSSLGYRAPAPEAIQPASLASATPQQAKQAGVGACPTLT